MAVVEVLQLGNPTLRMKSIPVEDVASKEIAKLRDDLADTLKFYRETTGYGRGIAAPQIGALKRVVFININKPWLLVNPEIIEKSSQNMVVWDACLSYLSIFFQVSRSKKIKVSYQTQDGGREVIEAEDELSELLQHEIDHLDGILAIDRVTDMKSICTRQEYEKRHKSQT